MTPFFPRRQQNEHYPPIGLIKHFVIHFLILVTRFYLVSLFLKIDLILNSFF